MISTSAPFTEERRRGTRARMAEDTLQVPRVQLGFQLVIEFVALSPSLDLGVQGLLESTIVLPCLGIKFSKFGMVRIEPNQVIVNGTPEYARSCCEASLKRLAVDYIDLYYQHRIDTSVPIEDTMEELKKLVNEGKIKYIGLSEAGAGTIRRAYAVHPITVVQMEWNLWTREIEEEIVPLCRELEIGIVTYSPLGRGFFAGKAMVESLPANSFLQSLPRCQGENLEKNKILYDKVQYLAEKHGCIPAQLALAWIVHQGDHVVPVPGVCPHLPFLSSSSKEIDQGHCTLMNVVVVQHSELCLCI
ncbi:hypothetical protein ACLB2K_061089 [Fragaria x ananassa]